MEELVINTPLGKLCARKVGCEEDYPGMSIEIEMSDGTMECLAVVEYDQIKEKVQAVVYADAELADDPSHIITYDFLSKE